MNIMWLKLIKILEKYRSSQIEKKLLKHWEGLGYYSRVKNLRKTAQVIKKNFQGKLPDTFDDLISLHLKKYFPETFCMSFDVDK